MRQELLLELPEQEQPPSGSVTVAEAEPAPKLKAIERRQCCFRVIDIEELVPADHKARAVWQLSGRLDLSGFGEHLRSREGRAGAPAWDPRLLVSIWVYAYSEGIGSAREIERLMEYEPGLMWLSAMQEVNHHTLSDFRTGHREALEAVFADLLMVLEQAGVVQLDRVMHDGTKIRAQAGADTLRRQATLETRLEQARQLVAELGAAEEGQERRAAARRRAAAEALARLEHAAQELEKFQHERRPSERADTRVSLSEPEARVMKHGDHALAPSYNAQITTESGAKVIVGAMLTQSSSDAAALQPALQAVEARLGRKPNQVVVDGGYTTAANIVAASEQGLDLIGSLGDQAGRKAGALKAHGIDAAFGPEAFVADATAKVLRCPAGNTLVRIGQSTKRGKRYEQYRAEARVCANCEFRARCSPGQKGRTVSLLRWEDPRLVAFRQKMETEEANPSSSRRR
jgi:transposase